MSQWRKRFFGENAFCRGFLLFLRTGDGLVAPERGILIGNITELYLKGGEMCFCAVIEGSCQSRIFSREILVSLCWLSIHTEASTKCFANFCNFRLKSVCSPRVHLIALSEILIGQLLAIKIDHPEAKSQRSYKESPRPSFCLRKRASEL